MQVCKEAIGICAQISSLSQLSRWPLSRVASLTERSEMTTMKRVSATLTLIIACLAASAGWLLLSPQQADAGCAVQSPIVWDNTGTTNLPNGGTVYGEVMIEGSPIFSVWGLRQWCVNIQTRTTATSQVSYAFWSGALYMMQSQTWNLRDYVSDYCFNCYGGAKDGKALWPINAGVHVWASGAHYVSVGVWGWTRYTQADITLY